MSQLVASVQKDTDESIAYVVNWADALNAGTISTVTWTVPAGITNAAISSTTTTATIRLSGGTAGVTYTIECLVTTSLTETLQVHFDVTVMG